MQTTPELVNWTAIFEAIHAVSTVLIPLIVGGVVLARKRIKAALDKTVDETFTARAPILKKIADESNAELLTRINGTYVRSREQQIRDENATGRLDRIETKVDNLATHVMQHITQSK